VARLDGTAAAFVEANQVIRPVHFVFMDFLGDPLRANDSGMTIVISGQADANLNGQYDGLTGEVAEISSVRVGVGGSDTVTARLSGLQELDADMLNIIGDESKWKGRLCQMWRIVWDQNNASQGAYQHFYTGYMVDVIMGGGADEQFIEVSIENYLTAYVNPSNRTYLSQHEFDAGDLSGTVTPGLPNSGGGTIPGLQPPPPSGRGGPISGPGSFAGGGRTITREF
jgi:hypothetical protein